MTLLNSIAAFFGKRQESARPDVKNVTYSDSIMESFGVASSGVTVSATSAMRVSAVAACVAKISGAIVSMPLHIYKHNGGDIPERLPRDPLWYSLNEQPSAQFTSASFWEGISMGQLLRGDAFVLIRRSMNGNVKELLPLPWSSVSPIRSVDGVRYYVNLPSHNISTWFDPADILHFTGLGFDDVTMKSMSVIQYGARGAIGNAIAMTEYSGKFFEGGAHPSMILATDKKMTPEQITAMQTAFGNKYSGLSNAHALPFVLTEGVTAKEFHLSAADAQLIEGQKFAVLDICRAFGVPPHMVGETSGSTTWGSGIESMGRSFVQYTLQPWLKKIENELNRKLFPKDTGKFIEFHREALIEGDSAAQAAYFRAGLGGPGSGDGWLTVNEVRKIKRQAPVEGGDEPFKAQRDTGMAAPNSAQDTTKTKE